MGIAGAPLRVVITAIGENEPLPGELCEEEPPLFPRDGNVAVNACPARNGAGQVGQLVLVSPTGRQISENNFHAFLLDHKTTSIHCELTLSAIAYFRSTLAGKRVSPRSTTNL